METHLWGEPQVSVETHLWGSQPQVSVEAHFWGEPQVSVETHLWDQSQVSVETHRISMLTRDKTELAPSALDGNSLKRARNFHLGPLLSWRSIGIMALTLQRKSFSFLLGTVRCAVHVRCAFRTGASPLLFPVQWR